MSMPERAISFATELSDLLARVTLRSGSIDFDWQWNVDCVRSGGEVVGWFITSTFERPDRDTGIVGRGMGRPWFVALGATVSSVVKTCFAAVKMNVEHELSEAFHYNGVRLFDPHRTVEELAAPSTGARTYLDHDPR